MPLAHGGLGVDVSASVLSRDSLWPDSESAPRPHSPPCVLPGSSTAWPSPAPTPVTREPARSPLQGKPGRRRLKGPSAQGNVVGAATGTGAAPPPLSSPPCCSGPMAGTTWTASVLSPSRQRAGLWLVHLCVPSRVSTGLTHRGLKYVLNKGPLGSDVPEYPMVLESSILLRPVLLPQEHRGPFPEHARPPGALWHEAGWAGAARPLPH